MRMQYRHELKYKINAGVYAILKGRLDAVLQKDANTEDGIYRVTSLYFDNIYDTAYRDKMSGAMNRKKFRIRTYNLNPEKIRLEEKIKDDNVGYKKNAWLTYDEYHSIISGDYDFMTEERFSDTSAEDFFTSVCASGLKPSVIVDYMREPYICNAGNVRVTLDSRLSVCYNTFDMFDKNALFYPVWNTGDAVLEVKYDGFLPLYIKEVLSGLPIMQESVSKFMLCKDKAQAMHGM